MRTANRPRRARIVSRHGLLALRTADGRVPRIVIVEPGESRDKARARLIEDARALGYLVDERRMSAFFALRPRYLAALIGSVGVVALAAALLPRPAPVPPVTVAISPPVLLATPVATPVIQIAAARPPVATSLAPREPAGSAALPPPPALSAPLPVVPPPVAPPPVAPPLDVRPDWPPFIPYADRFPGGPLSRQGQDASSAPTVVATPAISPLVTSPNGNSPASAIPLAPGGPRSGQLVGNRAGAFAYFAIPSPSLGSTGTLVWAFDPSDPLTSLALGLNLWQDGRLLAATSGSGAVPGQNSLTFTSSATDPILVQLGNYAPSTTVTYQIALATLAVTAQSSTAAGTPAVATSLGSPLLLAPSADGLLAGNRAGSFVYYWLPPAIAGQSQAISLAFTPGGADVGSGVFLSLYQDGQLLTHGQASGGEAPGCLTVHFAPSSASPVLVQLANYNPTGTIHYSLRRA